MTCGVWKSVILRRILSTVNGSQLSLMRDWIRILNHTSQPFLFVQWLMFIFTVIDYLPIAGRRSFTTASNAGIAVIHTAEHCGKAPEENFGWVYYRCKWPLSFGHRNVNGAEHLSDAWAKVQHNGQSIRKDDSWFLLQWLGWQVQEVWVITVNMVASDKRY